jgi:hypothetical protein
MRRNQRFVIRWIGIILSILVTLVAVSVHAQEGGFSESFDDPNLPGWERSPNAEVVDGVLHIEREGYALYGGEWGDLNLHVRANLAGEGLVVVSYRVSEVGDYSIHIGMDEITLHKARVPVAQEPIEQIPSEEWFSLELIAMGETHEIMLNGQLALIFADAEPLPPGGIALTVVGEALGNFDDLSLFSLGETPPPEPAPTEELAAPQEAGEAPSTSDLTWVRTGGPPGGIGYDIRYKFDDPNTWFVTDNFAGVHISTDNGLTWLPSNEGVPGQQGIGDQFSA